MFKYLGSKLRLTSKFPLVISGLLINNHLKSSFSLARLFEQRYYLKVMNDSDIEDIKKNYLKRIEDADNVHIDIRDNKMDNKKFTELFDMLAKTKKEEIHLDFSNTKMDDEKLESIIKCFSNWNLKALNLHISNVDLTNRQFENMMNSIEKQKNLKLLNLEMENVNLNRFKRNKMETIVNNMPNLAHVSINLRNNNLTEEDTSALTRILDRFDVRHFFF